MVEKPSKVVARWAGRGRPRHRRRRRRPCSSASTSRSSGLVLIGGAAIAGGIVILGVRAGDADGDDARRDDPGDAGRLPAHAAEDDGAGALDAAGRGRGRADWLETPDQAVVWGTALGLQGEIEEVLSARSRTCDEQPRWPSSTYFPAWYRTIDGSSFASGSRRAAAASIFSGSAVPDLGGMMSALGTIGNSPSSSGSGGGGGFSGGGSGGGGGGAGGGF